MQSSSVAFLQVHGFQIEKPFTIGVPYLSRYEEVLARAEESRINGNIPNPDFLSRIFDPAQLAFITKIKATITEWLGMEVHWNELARKSLLLMPESRKSRTSLTLVQITSTMLGNCLVGLL